MARAKQTETTALAKWDEELAAAAQAAEALAKQQASGGAKTISTKSATMTIDDNPVPGNVLVGVIAGFTLCNKYYEEDFDPDNPSSPVCYAYGQNKDEMGPHDDAEKPQSERCAGCPQNEFGSADRGKGKACRNTYQLLVMPAGSYDHKADRFELPESAEELVEAELYALSVPPTSLKAFSGYVSQLAGNLRPPWACFTKIGVVPDPKTQQRLTFQLVQNAPTDFLSVLKDKNLEAMKQIEVPFQKNSEREQKPAKKKGSKGRF